jgi:hypothetical protein
MARVQTTLIGMSDAAEHGFAHPFLRRTSGDRPKPFGKLSKIIGNVAGCGRRRES